MFKRSSIVILSGILVLFLSFNVEASKVLRLQLVYPKTSMVAVSTQFFAEKVESYTKGKVRVKIFYPGQLVKSEEGLTALQRGLIDAYAGSMLYFAGVVPEVNGEWLPFCWRGVEDVLDIYYGYGFLELMRSALDRHGVFYVAPVMVATMGLMTNFPIHSVEDLKGKNIRAVGMEAKIVKALGGSPVSIAGAEQYTALQRGTVEGTDYPWYTLEDYRFYEVVKYVSVPAIHTPGIVEILISKKVWEGLSPEEKWAIERAGFETAVHSARLSADSDARARKFGEEHGISFVELPLDEVGRFRQLTAPLYNEHAQSCEICKRQVELIAEFYKEIDPAHPSLNALSSQNKQ
ncbi:TRAP transporter substrate-binding protein [Thermodesulforhabdus norvegica]|uniref:TRAP-type C4-dicarboxylate transport system, substrate-binding protein n=1 Tax=Thermodesulforhabdus norvegica TaxID=39841 RepID=A0A1I4W8X8_9BACT|nr:TRAP transporter substrate-binding protein DctP [Thermodesulforhabdus norvegica]SFN10141.1 TRAP-type C4-dicarboxylate transport system, substrate-binding protein [Thermodesulforhabdus norvegica]